MLLDNYKKESPIIGVAGMGGGINSYIFLSSGDDAGYVISKSLRFNPGDSAYLSRTPSSAGNRKTWTWSGWVKRSGLGFFQYLFDCDSGSSPEETPIRFWTDDRLNISAYTTSSQYNLTTTAKFRDTSAWYHIVVAFDTTNATPDDRIKLYVNGAQITEFDARTNPSENTNYYINSAIEHNIGRAGSGNFRYLSAYLADIHFIDGQALAPTDFGEFDTSGVWQPKAFDGTHGTNGFHLDFNDNSGTTATTLGKDNSSNSNNWTPNGFSVAAGSGNDSLLDSPSQIADQTDSGAGGTVKGNYCTMSPIDKKSTTLSNGNLKAVIGSNSCSRGTFFAESGKWYFEYEITSVGNPYAGIASNGILTNYSSENSVVIPNTGLVTFRTDGTQVQPGYTVTHNTTAIYSVAMDLDNNKVWWGKAGQWYQYSTSSANQTTTKSAVEAGNGAFDFSGNPSKGWTVQLGTSSNASTYILNAGQRAFEYPSMVPSGYNSLNTANIPTPTGPAAEPNKYFDTRSSLLAGGSNARWTISDMNFSTDLSVSKSTSNDEYWVWTDSVRGFDKVLKSDEDNQEATGTAITNVSATGFTATNNWFSTGRTYATFNWDAGTSNTTVAAGGKNTTAYNTASTWSNNWTASGNGFGSAPPANAFDANFDNYTNNSAGGQYLTWTTTSYTLSGTLEININSSGGRYNVWVNGERIIYNTPSSREWISCGSFTDINEIQFGGTSHNSATGLNSGDGVNIYEIRVAGKTLIDSGTTPTNAPTIASTLRANPEAGFSIVTYSGGGSGSANSDSGQSFAHGLNSSPDLVIVKKRTGANGWPVYHSSTPLGALNINSLTSLDTGSYLFAQRRPSDSVVYLGNNPEINASGNDYVAYCFSQILGYSATGKYTGTGNDDGRFIFTGFRPRLIFMKAYSSNSNNNAGWCIHDASIDPNNESDNKLAFENDDPFLNNSHTGIDILSNGFKLKNDANGQSNYSGWDYIYYAVAENPFKSARAR